MKIKGVPETNCKSNGNNRKMKLELELGILLAISPFMPLEKVSAVCLASMQEYDLT